MSSNQIRSVANEYFHLMATRYPVLATSDEFYLFTRAEEGLEHLDTLDLLDGESVEQTVIDVKTLLTHLEKIKPSEENLDDRIDKALLKSSMLTFVREWGDYKMHTRNPCLYLKIAMVGFDLAFSGEIRKKDPALLRLRLEMIPRFLTFAKHGLREVPTIYQEVALDMISASRRFFTGKVSQFLKENNELFPDAYSLLEKAILAFDDFGMYLERISTVDRFACGKIFLSRFLKESFLEKRDLPSILRIGEEEYEKTIHEMEVLASDLGEGGNWKKILSRIRLKDFSSDYILNLYRDEIVKLRSFLEEKNLLSVGEETVDVCPTPPYLLPIRATASYRAAIGGSRPTFYVTLPREDLALEERENIVNSIHIEYLFMSAHEVYPGHHVLDTARVKLSNPTRRQLESPLFYEGWSCYGEQLIQDTGYVQEPEIRLIGLKRRLWRSIRIGIDIMLHTERMDVQQAAQRLVEIGYPPEEAYLQARQYTLTYGYQLCYTLGKTEFTKLKEKYAGKLGLSKFHEIVLSNGEIPFSFLEEKLKEAL